MKTTSCTMRLSLLCVAARLGLAVLMIVPWAGAAEPEVFTVAIFNFESNDDPTRELGPKAAMLINSSLSADPHILTVERAELEKVLGEQAFGLSGTVSADTAARVGHLTGAKILVTGRVFRVDDELVLVAKIIGTETSRVYGELVKGKSTKPVTELSAELAGKIAATIKSKGPTLVAKVEPSEERIARIRKALNSGTLPSVSVKIAEQHHAAEVRRIIDPAAETELAKVLQECGFTVLEEKSAQKPEVIITGESFSAFGLRRFNLISCKARVEVKAQNRTGEILAIDRQTSVAVDIAEQTAAKTALQEASLELAERLAPKLVRK